MLSMSMMVENRKISNEISIPKTSPSIWILVKYSNCYKCKSSFVFGEENTIVEYVEESLWKLC